MENDRLGQGEFLGLPYWQRDHDGLILTLTTYGRSSTYRPHTHEHPTIFVLIKGAHYDTTARYELLQPPLTGVFHSIAEPHATRVGPDGMLGVNVEMPQAWLKNHELSGTELGGSRLLTSAGSRLSVLRFLASLSQVDPFRKGELATAVVELLAPAVTHRGLTPRGREPSWLCRADEFLQSNSHLAIGLRHVAEEVRVHPVYCARAFRRYRGCTVSERLRQLRIATAGELILGDGATLVEAALRSGFADQAHFSRCASRMLGFSPQVLKNAQKNLIRGP